MEVGRYHNGKKGNDAIWIIVDCLISSAHFLHMKMKDSVDKLTKLYVNEVVRLNGVLVFIVSDQDPFDTIQEKVEQVEF
jgi:hypothetical protein